MTGHDRQLPLDLRRAPALGAEDFFVSASNRQAVAWMEVWPDWPGPLFILSGPPGAGKTHLLNVWRLRSRARLIPADRLATLDIGGLSLRGQALAIDDADHLAGTMATERALLHLYNLVSEGRGHLLLAASQPVAQWPIKLPDLASRLRAAPASAIDEPDDNLLAQLLIKLFADQQLSLGQEAMLYLLPRIERRFDAIRSLVAAIDKASLAQQRAVTVPLIKAVMATP